MAENSAIAWTHHTHNEWIGCTEVSFACDLCYARSQADNRFHIAKWGNHPRHRTSLKKRCEPYGYDRKAAAAGERHRILRQFLERRVRQPGASRVARRLVGDDCADAEPRLASADQ